MINRIKRYIESQMGDITYGVGKHESVYEAYEDLLNRIKTNNFPQPTEFEEAVEEMAIEVMGYTFQEYAGLRNCAGQLMMVARKQVEQEMKERGWIDHDAANRLYAEGYTHGREDERRKVNNEKEK